MHPLDQSYHDLANAIVLQAVEDYRNALNGIAYHHHSPESVIKSIERFFRSDYFEVLSTVKGEYLIEQLRKEHNERSKDESNTDTGNA